MEEVVAEFEKLVASNIDGIECYYPIHSEELTECCVNFCEENDLMITIGCDCHGEISKKRGNILWDVLKRMKANLD